MLKRILVEPVDIILSLVKGMAVTLRQFFSKPCTIQYPEERLIWPQRTRGRLIMPRTAEGNHKCTACLLCQRTCPNGSIEIKVKAREGSRPVLEDYLYHLDRCTFCGLCVEVCPFDALRMSHEHELAVLDRALLKLHLQTETFGFNSAWQGGLPAKADAIQTAKTSGPKQEPAA
jgi:NADH-quinone oxidoreductase subunit I